MKCKEGMETMRNEFTAIIERDGNWYIAFCPEIPGANGQGKTQAEACGSLAEAIALILEDRLRADVGTASGGFAAPEEGSWTRRIAKYFSKKENS